MNIDVLFGKTMDHLVPVEGTKFFVHKQMLSDFLKLQREAREAGFDLQITSAFRDYERQLKIWNAKASGQRVLIDDQEKPLEFSRLSPREIIYAILRWSALPGFSRHHWGTDIDVFDGHTQTLEAVKLVPSECIGNGPAAKLHEWLDSRIDQDEAFGFYRPYKTDRGGVSPERWHLSYAPLSTRILSSLTLTLFRKNLEENDILLKHILLEDAHDIFERFVVNIDSP